MIQMQTDSQLPAAPPGSALHGGSAAVPYVWAVLRLIPHMQDKNKHTRRSMLLAAQTIEQVWEYLAADRADAATEIESITRLAPLVATLPPNGPGSATASTSGIERKGDS